MNTVGRVRGNSSFTQDGLDPPVGVDHERPAFGDAVRRYGAAIGSSSQKDIRAVVTGEATQEFEALRAAFLRNFAQAPPLSS